MFAMIFCLLFAAINAVSALLIQDFSQLALDSNGHLEDNWLLANNGCGKLSQLEERTTAHMDDILAREKYGFDGVGCFAVCLDLGLPVTHLSHVIPEHTYRQSESNETIEEWAFNTCQKVEVGFISYNENPAIVYWINNGQRVKIADLLRSEFHTFWTTTFLGHRFQIVDKVTEKILGQYKAMHNAFYHIGDAGSFIGADIGDEERGVKDLFRREYARSKMVTRTFTEFGFQKGRLPEDVWGSIQTYYYNNRNNYCREEYENKGLTVNWYEVDPKFLGMPWGLKGYWQRRLQKVVERWIGGNIEIEKSDIYGMRRYEDGARLLMHVDRETTHAVSLIVNVAQGGVRSPWNVEIYDHAYRLHEIEMQPGDIVYYESARCLHGRMAPLDGGYYVNFFTHYRPIGDPQWYKRPNPEGTPEPIINITGLEVPTLSKYNHVAKSENDLFDFWKMVGAQRKLNTARSDL